MSTGVSEYLESRTPHGDAVLDEATISLYDELHRIAAHKLRSERNPHTLQATALVHETYLKLAGGKHRQFASSIHFLAVASRVMRQVLVDYARARGAEKRGGELVALTSDLGVAGEDHFERVELLDLNESLDALGREDRELASLIEMRFFGGLTAEEIAEELGQSVHVVRHDMRLALAWMRRDLNCRGANTTAPPV